MKYWDYVELENWDLIQQKLNAWIDTTDLVQTGYFWNTVSVIKLMTAVPELRQSLSRMNVFCTYAAVIIAYNRGYTEGYLENIHVDDMFGVSARLQLPVRNTKGSFTHFFSAPKDKIQKRLLPNGHAFYWIDKNDAKHMTKVCIDRPTYIRTSEPHAVQVNSECPDERITITLRLNKDPGALLK